MKSKLRLTPEVQIQMNRFLADVRDLPQYLDLEERKVALYRVVNQAATHCVHEVSRKVSEGTGGGFPSCEDTYEEDEIVRWLCELLFARLTHTKGSRYAYRMMSRLEYYDGRY